MSIKNNISYIKKMKDYILPYKKLATIKDSDNLTVSKLSEITGVKRDIISRFLDGKKINSFDYDKILDHFPTIRKSQIENKIDVAKVYMFGVVSKGGFVRHLHLNEQKEFYFVDRLFKLFTREIVGIHSEYSSAKFICQVRDCSNPCDIFKANYDGQLFLVKTVTAAYFGVMRAVGNEYWLCDKGTLEPISFGEKNNRNPEDIIECYDVLFQISNNWSQLVDPKFEHVKINRNET